MTPDQEQPDAGSETSVPRAGAVREPVTGSGYVVGSLDGLGEDYGFRKVRTGLGVTAFGINALVLPPAYEGGLHFHDEQEETYFVHAGMVEIFFGDGSTHLLGPGGLARVDASTHRGLRNAGDSDAVILVAGGRGGYVGRDGRLAEGSTRAGTGMPVRAGTGIPESGAGGVGAIDGHTGAQARPDTPS